MNIKNIFVALAVLVIATSCKKDDNDGDGSVELDLLIGTWNLDRETDNDGFDETYDSSCNNFWEFTEDTLRAVWDYDCDGAIDDDSTASYRLDGNEILPLNGPNPDDTRAFIRTLTNSNLRIELETPEGEGFVYKENFYFSR
ncbi:lipocalin family protein [Patiriisocius hiemis]|uniref:Lipocalin family protein n=1 Tax=Patiriisocius hiemis TaxID=3075604 RepID=A0ABU2YI87_9FLAO|nr:lipocalin family protein [Constantimarinum sp. W242]MDT0556783.1 lipocalin family protein [Constantimarinum sp. W242]